MAITLTKTDAEEQLARQFAAVASDLPGGGWMPGVRTEAMRAFAKSGLPHRRLEDWKYSDLRAKLTGVFPPAGCSLLKVDEALLARALGQELATLPALRVVLINGRYLARLMPRNAVVGADVRIDPLSAVLGLPDYDWMKPCFVPGHSGSTDVVLSLNSAFASDGVVLRVSKDFPSTFPIHIVSIIDGSAPQAVATRCLVKVDEGGSVTIIESHVELGQSPSQATAVTQISVMAGATAHHIKHVAVAPGSVHLGRVDIELSEAATYRGFQLTAGAGFLRNESHVRFTGPNAKLDLSGLMLGRGKDHIDTTLIVDHTTTGCESRELFKAVLDDRARGVFQGKVVVAAEAQKTDGKQMAQALMLSEDAEFDSKPELEIYADDVVCGHGATATELDADMLFYLRSRGIPQPGARALLVESFAAGALDKIEDEGIRAALRTVAVDWLGKTS